MATATNAAVAKVVGYFTNAHLVATDSPLLKPDDTKNEILFLDGTHPNEAGYTVSQKTLLTDLSKHIRRD